MLLDAGNSRLKWALRTAQGLGAQHSLAHRDQPLGEVFEQAWQNLAGIDEVWISNVAGPRLAESARAWMARYWPAARVRFAQSSASTAGVRNGYEQPQRLGVDRWLALIGAYHAGHAPCWVADCGTAVTLDCLAADGRHRGGLIVPGLYAMRQVLDQATHALGGALPASGAEPKPNTVPGERSEEPMDLGKDTQSAIKIGTVYALVATIERLRRNLPCLLTGGDAPALLPWLGEECRHVPDLVLQGLAVLASEESCV